MTVLGNTPLGESGSAAGLTQKAVSTTPPPRAAAKATPPSSELPGSEASPSTGEGGFAFSRIRGGVRVAQRSTATPKKHPFSDPRCEALHAEPFTPEDQATDAEGGLRWAFVWVSSGVPAGEYPVPQQPVLLDQTGCRYVPHVLGVRVGQELRIRNSDPLLHNVHALPFSNKGFNFGLPDRGTEEVRRFEKPETMVRVKCDIHPWMNAWIGVVEHPFFAVTGKDGGFVIDGLPAGRVTLRVWHERFIAEDVEVDVRPAPLQTPVNVVLRRSR